MANEFILRRGLISRGGVTLPYRSVTSTSSATAEDYLIDCSGGSFTLSLLSALSISGFVLVIKNSGSGTIVLAPTLGQTIEGTSALNLNPGESVTIESNGTNWIRVGSSGNIGFFDYASFNAGATASINNDIIEIGSGTFTLNLPTAVGATGKWYSIKKNGTGTLTIDPNGAQTIDSRLTRTLTNGEYVGIVSNGSNWIAVSKPTNTIVLGHSSVAPPVNNTLYYIGILTEQTPSISQAPSRQVLAITSGWITRIVWVSWFGAGTSSATSTYTLNNVTASTSTTISNNRAYNTGSSTVEEVVLGTPLQVTFGDVLEIRWQTPTWGSGGSVPTFIVNRFILYIE